MTRERCDVFVSLTGRDRVAVRPLVDALRKAGLTVFVDEDHIALFDPITAEIEAALRSAKILVAYYSASFSSRPACQFELTAAFLAGAAEGDPTRRIVVINPEPGTDHLHPAELADGRFAVLPAPGEDRRAMKMIVSRVRARAEAVSGGMGGTAFTDRPRWFTERVPGWHGFVGRYPDRWRLHSALTAADLPLTRDATGAPVAALVGMPGIGKTALAAAYAWQFGAAHPGGVFWVSLAGAGASATEVLARYADAVRTVAEQVGLPVAGASRAHVFGALGDFIADRRAPILWIVDDLPPGLDPAIVDALVVPAGARVRTIITSQRLDRSPRATTVELGAMDAGDAGLLLRSFREADTAAEAEALGRVARRLGGHAKALTVAGGALRDRHGLVSYQEYADRLDADPTATTAIAEPIRSALSSLDSTQRAILQLSSTCSPQPLPAQLIAHALGSIDKDLAGGELVGAALVGLRDRLLVDRMGTLWEVHSLVRDAARAYLYPPWPSADIARAAAEAVVALVTSELAGTARASLIHHGEAVAGRPDLPADLHEALLRQIAGHYESRGEPILACPHRERILGYHPDSPSALAAAAAARHQTGDHEAALAHAATALRLCTGEEHTPLRHRCHRIQAEALDALGRATEADPIWALLLSDAWAPRVPPADHLATRLAHARALRMRGRLAEAKRLLRAIVGDPDPTPDLTAIGTELTGSAVTGTAFTGSAVTGTAFTGSVVTSAAVTGPPMVDSAVTDERQAARTELANIQLMTDEQIAARHTAAAVVRHYHERGLARHRNAIAAEQVFAAAQQAIHLWELRPDPTAWVRAELSLRQLRDDYRASHGRLNTFTLSASVAHAQALVSLGRPVRARDELVSFLPDIVSRLGGRHPLYFQACFLLGQAHSQCGQHARAVELHTMAFDGQSATLGPEHPHTLRTQFELGVALKLVGDGGRASAMIRAVRRTAPRSTGRTTDLFAQAVTATVLMWLPAWIWRRLGGSRSRHHDRPA